VKPLRVLIVDDNDLNIQLAAFVLAEGGMEVESAAGASQALAQIAAFRPDLILMDIQMPDMDGLELTRRLRADPLTRRIVVVAFTAFAMKGDEAKMRAAGCDGYVAKPIDIATFASTIRAFAATEDADGSSGFGAIS
jgi:CheY-like chemotaxis protein